MGKDASGRVPFEEFMRVMGLQADKGDTCGLSSLIAQENERYLGERQLDHQLRSPNFCN